jgi:hypothetical protein
MYSILCWILSIWEALGWKFCIFGLIHALSTRGEVWAWNGLLDAFRRFSGGFEPFLGSSVHRSDRSWSPVWPVRVLVLFTCCTLVWPVVLTGLTGQGWVVAAALYQVVSRMHSSRGSCIGSGGSLHVCRGSTLWFFELWFGGLCSLLEHSFISDVSSRCPCLRGSRLVFFRWSFSLPLFGFRSIVGVSFYLFLFLFFSLVLLYVGVVNALIKGEIEDHVWFEDRWMVAFWCDEWLATLCGLILG